MYLDSSSALLITILMNSRIASAADQENEGGSEILFTYEASTLNLYKNTLSVLSTCETGVGDYFPLEGVYGLKLVFNSAGA